MPNATLGPYLQKSMEFRKLLGMFLSSFTLFVCIQGCVTVRAYVHADIRENVRRAQGP